MKAFPILVILALTYVTSAVRGQPTPDPVRKMEISGDYHGCTAPHSLRPLPVLPTASRR